MKTPNRIPAALVALATVVVAASAAWCQTLHLVTEPARPAPGQEVRVRLVAGARFDVDEAAPAWDPPPERLWNSGRARLAAPAGADAITFTADEAGVQLLAFSWAADADVRRSFGKALVVIGDSRSSERIWRSEVGQRLEIVPETDPAALADDGGRFDVRVLFERGPLAGATVVAVAEGALQPDGYRRAVTDGLGRVRFDLDRPGRWLIHLAHKAVERGDTPRWVLLESSLLLEAGPS